MHPFKSHADKSGKSKMDGIHKGGSIKTVKNLTESGPAGGYKKIDGSHSDTMEIKDHPVAMARGGKAGKGRGKHKSPVARGLTPPASPSPDEMAGMQAGAGGMSSPSPAPAPIPTGSPGMPMMQKSGGKVKRASGGRIPTAGQATGEARLQQAGIKRRK